MWPRDPPLSLWKVETPIFWQRTSASVLWRYSFLELAIREEFTDTSKQVKKQLEFSKCKGSGEEASQRLMCKTPFFSPKEMKRRSFKICTLTLNLSVWSLTQDVLWLLGAVSKSFCFYCHPCTNEFQGIEWSHEQNQFAFLCALVSSSFRFLCLRSSCPFNHAHELLLGSWGRGPLLSPIVL